MLGTYSYLSYRGISPCPVLFHLVIAIFLIHFEREVFTPYYLHFQRLDALGLLTALAFGIDSVSCDYTYFSFLVNSSTILKNKR